MLVVMERGATPQQVQAVVRRIEEMGFEARALVGKLRTAVAVLGNQGNVDAGRFSDLAGVKEAVPVTEPYRQASREWQPENTVVRLPGGASVGGDDVVVMAGPCSVESEQQIVETAHRVRDAGATVLRGGAFKPRTSPYSFQGLGEQGLRWLARARQETGLPVVTEVMDTESVDLVARYADVLQVGARNMQNFSLLKRVGRAGKPVLLKRGYAATVTELLLAAEYVLAEGNDQVILCERGVRGFDGATRFVLDLAAIPLVHRLSHLPILADPSHGTGLRGKVVPMARAAVAAGADGLLIEVHPAPERALSDGVQTISTEEFAELMRQCRAIAEVIGRRVAEPAEVGG
jgi:3-deoxy-7-phosphoheptulonate synthase